MAVIIGVRRNMSAVDVVTGLTPAGASGSNAATAKATGLHPNPSHNVLQDSSKLSHSSQQLPNL
jgi:hypothetical protein